MKITIRPGRAKKLKTPFAAFLINSNVKYFQGGDAAIAAVLGRYARDAQREKVKEPLLWGPAEPPVEHAWAYPPALLKAYPTAEQYKIAAARALDAAKKLNKVGLAFWVEDQNSAELAAWIAEGCLLGNYTFEKYKARPAKQKIAVEILVPESALKAARARVAETETVARGVNFARDLINEPGAAVDPEILAQAAQQLGREGKFAVEILREGQLRKQGYNGLITVGKGSNRPPRLIIIRHRPKGAKKGPHVALVGKGITFDCGGISLKSADKMWQMKGDMAGAAAVLGAMKIFARRKPQTNVTAIIAAAHNAIGPDAVHPGDIFIAKNGKSVMVDNTDAEGRLVLTDALHCAGAEGATHIADFATLTGAIVRALGIGMAGVFGNDEAWIKQVIAAGAAGGEDYWPMPLYEEYRELLNHPVADVNNISGTPNGGAITAALFLKEFVPDNVKWAHCDIAGPFLQEKPWRYYTQPGGIGFGVKTMVNLVK